METNNQSQTHTVPSKATIPEIPTIPNSQMEKPEKFKGANIKRWQPKMLFYLTTLKLNRYLTETVPAQSKDGQESINVVIEAWKQGNFLCRGYILNGLDDSMYNVYSPKKTSKELWESLAKKYHLDDTGTKKFVVGKFLDFKMVDGKDLLTRIEDLQVIYHEMSEEGMPFVETFQVEAMIEKLPSAWKDFKNYLKHKRKEMNLEDLILKLRIERDNRKSEKKYGNNEFYAKANVVESSGNKRKRFNKGFKGNPKKFKGECYNCGKIGHMSRNCTARSNIKNKESGKRHMDVQKRKNQAHLTEVDLCTNIDDMHLTA